MIFMLTPVSCGPSVVCLLQRTLVKGQVLFYHMDLPHRLYPLLLAVKSRTVENVGIQMSFVILFSFLLDDVLVKILLQ